MYRIDDEEEKKKKRREEADFIINSINSKEENNMSDFINSINYANSNNLNIETKNDYEKDFINRINEANSIIESINPSYKPAEKIPVEERNDYFGNTLKATVPEKEDTTLNNNINENIVTTQKNIPGKEEIKKQYNNIKNQTVNPNIKNQSMFSNMNVNLSNINQVQNYKDISRVDIKAQNEAKQTNKQIEQGGYNKLEATIRTILNNISGGIKQTVGGLANVITTATNLGVRGLEGTAKIFGYDDLGNKLNNTYNKINDFSKDISNKANYDQLVTNQLKDNTIKTSGNVTNIISNMIGSAAIGYAVGVPGTVTQGLSVSGRSSQEVLEENKDNIGKATLTGLAKGYTSYLTEKLFDANILTGGAGKTSIQKGINRLISEKINSKLGKETANRFVGIIGENAEELIEDNVDNLIDKLINNKETPDFLSKDWWENTSETVKMTTLSTFIMQLLGLGGASFQEIEGDLNAEKWINEAKKIIEQDNMAIKFDTTQVKDIDEVKSFYVTKFTPDGNIDGIYETRGEEILNPKHSLNIVPVVIKDNQTNSYNVIDGNTGVVLDNTQYESTLEAKMGFNDKASKLTDLQIKSINQKIDEANYMITDKIMQAIKIVDTQKNNFVQTDIENDSNSNSNNNIIENNTTQNVDNIQKNDTKIQVTDTNTSNIITQNEKGLKMENRTIENVSDKKVKSYQTDFPDIAPEIQEMANNFQEDLANSIPGERYKIGDKWTGQKRSTTNELAQIKDETNASWERIGKALEDIANGKGDYSLAKKIELVLDEALTNGYKNIYGKTIMPNETYLTKKGQIEGKDYTKIESQYDPTEYMTEEDYRIWGERKINKKKGAEKNVRTERIRNENIRQEINRTEARKDNRGKIEIRKINEVNRKEIQDKLKKYENQQQKKLGKDFKVTLVDSNKITKTENIIANEFTNLTGIKFNYFETNKPSTQSAFYLDNSIFGKHNSLSSKKKTNFLPYHEFGHWLKINKFESWKIIHDIINNSITTEQINKYKSVLNNKDIFKNMSDEEIKEYVIEEIISDYIGNWANDIINWSDFINEGKLSEEYIKILIDISDKNISTHYNIFGTEEQQEQVYEEINKIMKNILNMNNYNDGIVENQNLSNIEKYSDRKDLEQEEKKAKIVYRRFSKDFIDKGYIDLNNKKINNIQEVADISQIFRNPKYETFRIIYMKDNEIVGQEAISSKMPGVSRVFLSDNNTKNYYKIKNRMKRLNANGYYMIHNHPSGKAKLSEPDLKTTEKFKNNIDGFKAHVVVNSGTYAYIDNNGNIENFVKIKDYKPDDIDKMLTNDPWTKIQLKTPEEVAKIMYDVKNNPSYSTLIFADSDLYGRIVIDIPNTFLNMRRKQIDGYIRNIARQNGANNVFLATTNKEVWLKAKNSYAIRDSILYSVDTDNNLYNITSLARETNEPGNKIFENNKTKAMRVSEETNDDNNKVFQKQILLLHNKIQVALGDNQSKGKIYLDKVTDSVAQKINKLHKIDVKNRKHILFYDDIRHMINKHGDIKKEAKKEQIPITAKDIEKIPEIISKYNRIIPGSNNNEGKTIKYIKRYSNNILYVVEVIPDESKFLKIKTMWKKSARVANDQQIPNLTSKTRPSSDFSTSNKSITQKRKNVKGKKFLDRKLYDKDTNPYDERVQAKNRAFIEEYQKNLYKEDILDDIDLEAGKTNAQDSSRFIEQEIQKIEKNGLWDNSIPVTRLTDIRKTIEDYLGLGLKKGHFRQHAYGIYKPDRDVIRVKEYKDIDNILHETGHAMDLGNRLKIDKEKIADELLSAIDKHGGYERENRQVRLKEGFAEVIREYGIVPEQAKSDYPQTVAVLEGLRKENAEFNKFITKVQEQIYNYIHQNPRNRGLSNLSIGEQTDKPKWTKQKIKQSVMMEIWDKDWALKSAVSEFEKIGNKKAKASENAYYLTRLVSGIGGKVTSMLADGYIDENGDKIMPGLSKLGEILENNPERFNDLRAYLVAKRDLEYKAKSLKTGIRTMDSKAIIEKFANDTQIQEAAKLVYDTLDGVLEYAVSNGLITKRMKDRIKESNMFYVPMQRVIERSGNTVGKKGAVVDIIKKRTGSELDVKDVLENIISNSSNIIQQVENNKVLKALYNQGEEIGLTGTIYDVIPAPVVKIGTQQLSTWENELKKQGVNTKDLDLDKTIDIFVPNNKVDSKNLITSFINEDGKRTYLQFNDDVLFKSIMNMDQQFMGKVLNYSRYVNLPLRYGATMANIGFAIPNMISDTTQASILSTAGFVPIVDNIYGVLDILAATIPNANKFLKNVAPEYANKNEMLYTLYKQSGATSSTRLSPYRESTQVLMKDVYGTKNSDILGVKEKYKPLKRLLDILTYIPEISEQSTRFEVFKKNYNYYKKKGTSETDSRILAALESRDATQDFNRTGALTREINQFIPFSAARVGSAYTFFEKVKANPKKVAFRLAILQVIAMSIKAMGYDDEEIEELNQRKKDDNFVLKIGNEIITIKKPQGIMRSILNLTEYIQDLFTGHIEDGKEGKKLTEWLWNALKDNLPADKLGGYVPNMITPLVENYSNRDFYYNTDIVKDYDLDLPNSEQYYEYNSQLAILLGKIFNYSPAKIDNLISGYFGGLGTQVTNVIDKISGKLGLSVEEPEMGAEDSAVARRFIVNINNYSASVDEMYNLKTELTKKKNGGTITNEEEKQLEKIESGISNVSKINKQIKEIKKDLTMSGKEKADKIKILQQQKTDMARQSLGKEPLYNENIEKNDKIQFYITTNSLKKNKYVLDMTPEMKKEYEKVAYDYYKKYESKGLYSSEYLEKIKTKSKDYAKNYMMNKYKQNLKKEE